MDLAVGSYAGKETGETALLRSLLGSFEAGDVLVADRFYCSFMMIALLLGRGVHACVRLHPRRHVDFRRGKSSRAGCADRIVSRKEAGGVKRHPTRYGRPLRSFGRHSRPYRASLLCRARQVTSVGPSSARGTSIRVGWPEARAWRVAAVMAWGVSARMPRAPKPWATLA